MAFNVNGRIQLQGPTNVSQLVAQINRQLSGINAKVKIDVDSSSLSKLNNFQTAISSISNSSQTIRNGIDDATLAMRGFGEQAGLASKRFAAFSLAAGTMVGFVVAIRQGIGAAVEFQRELVRLDQISSDGKDAIQGLASAVTDLAKTYGASSSDLIKSAVVLRQAGFSANQTKEALEALALAALSPNFDTFAKNTEGVIAILSQFKSESLNITQAFGSINAVAAEFAVEGKDIIDAAIRAGGAFSSLGGKFNEFISIFTSVRATTREGADTIATGLRTIFSRLQSDSTVNALRDLRINLRYTAEEAQRLGSVNLTNQFVGPYEAIRRISEGLRNVQTTDPVYSKILEQLGGQRQISRVLPLLQQGGIQERALSIAEAGGSSLFGNAAKAQDSLIFKAQQTKEAFQEVFRGIADNQGFQQFARRLLDIGNMFAYVLDKATPLVPLFITLSTVKLAQSLVPFAQGFASTALHPGGRSNSGYYNIRGYAGGGVVDGPPSNVDSVYGHLQPGEFVVRKAVAQQVGYDKLHRLNAGKFAEGGLINFPPGQEDVGPKYADIKNSNSISNIGDVARKALSQFGLKENKKRELSVVKFKDDDLGKIDTFGYTLLDFKQKNKQQYGPVLDKPTAFAEGGTATSAYANGIGPVDESSGLLSLFKQLRPQTAARSRALLRYIGLLPKEMQQQIVNLVGNDSRFVGNGAEAVVVAPNDKEVVRLALAINRPSTYRIGDRRNITFPPFEERPNIPQVLQPTSTNQVGKVLIERLPRVATFPHTNFEESDTKRLQTGLNESGYYASDLHQRNLGRLPNGEPIIIDPGFITKLTKVIGSGSGLSQGSTRLVRALGGIIPKFAKGGGTTDAIIDLFQRQVGELGLTNLFEFNWGKSFKNLAKKRNTEVDDVATELLTSLVLDPSHKHHLGKLDKNIDEETFKLLLGGKIAHDVIPNFALRKQLDFSENIVGSGVGVKMSDIITDEQRDDFGRVKDVVHNANSVSLDNKRSISVFQKMLNAIRSGERFTDVVQSYRNNLGPNEPPINAKEFANFLADQNEAGSLPSRYTGSLSQKTQASMLAAFENGMSFRDVRANFGNSSNNLNTVKLARFVQDLQAKGKLSDVRIPTNTINLLAKGYNRGGFVLNKDIVSKMMEDIGSKLGIDFSKMISDIRLIDNSYLLDVHGKKMPIKGSFNKNNGTISLNSQVLNSYEKVKSSLSHELGHALDYFIGKREGFSGYISNVSGSVENNYSKQRSEALQKRVGLNKLKDYLSYYTSPIENFADLFRDFVYNGNAETGRSVQLNPKQMELFQKNIINKAVKYQEVGLRTSRLEAARKVYGYNSGGFVNFFASGGMNQDSIPAVLTPGEFVFSRETTANIGPANLERANKTGKFDHIKGFNRGGFVEAASGKYIQGTQSTNIQELIASGTPLPKLENDLANIYYQKIRAERDDLTATQAMVAARKQAIQNIKIAVNPKFDISSLQTLVSGYEQFLKNNTHLLKGTAADKLTYSSNEKSYEKYLARLQYAQASTGVLTDANGNPITQQQATYTNRQVLRQISNDTTLGAAVVSPATTPVDTANTGFFNRFLNKVSGGSLGTDPKLQVTDIFSLLKAKPLADVQAQLTDVYKKKIAEENTGLTQTQIETAARIKAVDTLKAATSKRNNLDSIETKIKRYESIMGQSEFLDPTRSSIDYKGQTISKTAVYAGYNQLLARKADVLQNTSVIIGENNNVVGVGGNNPFVDAQAQELRKLRRAQIGIALASTVLPLAADAANRQFGTAQQSVRSGSEFGYQASNALSSGLTTGFAVGGALAASGVGAPIAIPAGVITGLIASVTSIFDTSKEIINAKISDSMERLSKTIELVNEEFERLGKLTSETLSLIIQDISRGQADVNVKLANEGNTPQEVRNILSANQPLQSSALALRQQLLSQISKENPSVTNPAELSRLLNNDPRARINTPVRTANRTYENLTIDQYLSVFQNGQPYSSQTRIGSENAARRTILRNQREISDVTVGQVALSFTSLRDAAVEAANGFQNFDRMLNNVVGSVSGNISQSRYRLPEEITNRNLGSASFATEFASLSRVFGERGRDASDYASNASRVFRQLPDTLAETLATGKQDDFNKILRRNLGIREDDTTSQLARLVSTVTDAVTGQKEQPLDRSNSDRRLNDAQNRLFEGMEPMLQAFKVLEQQINRFIAGLEASSRLQLQASQQFGRAAGIQFQGQRQEAQFTAARQLRSDVSSFITPEQERAPFQTSLSNLLNKTSFNGNIAEATPAEISRRLSQTQQDLGNLRPSDNSYEGATKFAEEQSRLTTQSARFIQALQLMSNASEKSAGAQNRLAELYNERQSRLGFARNYLTAGPEGQAEITRGLLLAREAVSSGGDLSRFSNENASLITRTLESLGKTKLGFADNIPASDLLNQFLRTTFPGLETDDSVNQEAELQKEIAKAYGEATTAANALAAANIKAAELINSNLAGFTGGADNFGNNFLLKLETEVTRLTDQMSKLMSSIQESFRRPTPQNNNFVGPTIPQDISDQRLSDQVPSRPESRTFRNIVSQDWWKYISPIWPARLGVDIAEANGLTRQTSRPEGFLENAWDYINPLNRKVEPFVQNIWNSNNIPFMRWRADGGAVYASKGMFKPKGTDTVPAMLTEGEFVVNKQATEANYGLLKRINSARAPIHLARGGAVYLADGGTNEFLVDQERRNGGLVYLAAGGFYSERLRTPRIRIPPRPYWDNTPYNGTPSRPSQPVFNFRNPDVVEEMEGFSRRGVSPRVSREVERANWDRAINGEGPAPPLGPALLPSSESQDQPVSPLFPRLAVSETARRPSVPGPIVPNVGTNLPAQRRNAAIARVFSGVPQETEADVTRLIQNSANNNPTPSFDMLRRLRAARDTDLELDRGTAYRRGERNYSSGGLVYLQEGGGAGRGEEVNNRRQNGGLVYLAEGGLSLEEELAENRRRSWRTSWTGLTRPFTKTYDNISNYAERINYNLWRRTPIFREVTGIADGVFDRISGSRPTPTPPGPPPQPPTPLPQPDRSFPPLRGSFSPSIDRLAGYSRDIPDVIGRGLRFLGSRVATALATSPAPPPTPPPAPPPTPSSGGFERYTGPNYGVDKPIAGLNPDSYRRGGLPGAAVDAMNFLRRGINAGLTAAVNNADTIRDAINRGREQTEAVAATRGELRAGNEISVRARGGNQLFNVLKEQINNGAAGGANAYERASGSNLLIQQILNQSRNSQGSQSLYQDASRQAAGYRQKQEVLDSAIRNLYVPNSSRTVREQRGFYNAPVPGTPRRYAFGGYTGPYSGGGDNIPAYLQGGEYVLRRGAVNNLGVDTLNALNTDNKNSLSNLLSGGRSQSPGGSSQDFAVLQQSMQLFNNSSQPLVTALNNFQRDAQSLADAMSKFPTSLRIEGKQTIEVIHNGAEIFASLEDSISEKIRGETTTQLQNYFSKNLPDVPRL